MSVTVTLMGVEVPVVPQPWPRIATGVKRYGDKLSADSTFTVARLGNESYDALTIFVPEVERRIPRYRWMGFDTLEQAERSTDEYGDHGGPTIPEIANAFRVAFSVNGSDVLAGLGKLVDPQVLQALVSGALEETVKSYYSTSRSASGEPASTSGSAPSRPTASTNGAGPVLASSGSSADGP